MSDVLLVIAWLALVALGIYTHLFIVYMILKAHHNEKCFNCPCKDDCIKAMIIGHRKLCESATPLKK